MILQTKKFNLLKQKIVKKFILSYLKNLIILKLESFDVIFIFINSIFDFLQLAKLDIGETKFKKPRNIR